MRKLNFNLSKYQIRSCLTIVIIAILSFILAYNKAKEPYGGLDYPPTHCGGSDQFDYNNMAYTFMKYNIIGTSMTDEYKNSFKDSFTRHKKVLSKVRERWEKETKKLILNKNNYEPRPYSYRPWLYPIVVGTTYKIFGYNFVVGRMVNVMLFTISTVLMFLLVNKLRDYWSGIVASLIFIFFPNVIQYTTVMLTEVLAVLMVIISLFAIDYAFKERNNNYAKFFLMGILLGLLVLSKQMFVFVLATMAIPIGIHFLGKLIKTTKETVLSGMFLLCGIFFLLFPWIFWNIATTGTTKLLTGTNAWSVIHAGYTEKYLMGKNKYIIRENSYKQYEERNNVKLKNDIKRALAGIEIFNEQISKPEIRKIIPQLVVYKITGGLKAPIYEWVLRMFFIVGIIATGLSIRNWCYIAVIIGNMLAIVLFVHENGRLLIPSFPVFVLFGAIGFTFLIQFLIGFIKYKKYSGLVFRTSG